MGRCRHAAARCWLRRCLSLLAGAALLVFLRQYREDVTSSDRARVVVAASLVPKGTPGDVVLEKRMYRIARVRSDDVREGALTDPNDLKGQAVTSDVFPGHQLTLGDLDEAKGKLPSDLADYDRAMTVPVDKAHGMAREDRGGRSRRRDHHDGLRDRRRHNRDRCRAGRAVMAVPSDGDSSKSARQQQVTIRVPDRAAQTLAAAADGGKVWLILRPPVGARSHGNDASATGSVNGKPLNADINVQVRSR